jgi:DNA-binding NtrC family response regulator
MAHLLVVDDVEAYLNSLKWGLSGEWDLLCARSLDEAIKILKTAQVDMALLDIRLSEVDPHNRDGLSILRWLKENRPGVPVVVMSAYQDFDAAVQALNEGARQYLKKPIDLRALKELLRGLAEQPSKNL